jgi:hypothetical protein
VEHLTKRQSIELTKLVIEQHGKGLTQRQFTEAVMDYFEDISGMEGLSPPDAMEIINGLWSIYLERNNT